MKLYPNLEVDASYQNFGSTWALVLRGKTEEIELTTNGLFNHEATNGQCDYQDHDETIGVIWTDEPSMRRFFFQQILAIEINSLEFIRDHSPANRVMGKLLGKRLKENSIIAADKKMRWLRKCHENFFDFDNACSPAETHSSGTIIAEKPDTDMKDAILAHAYRD